MLGKDEGNGSKSRRLDKYMRRSPDAETPLQLRVDEFGLQTSRYSSSPLSWRKCLEVARHFILLLAHSSS